MLTENNSVQLEATDQTALRKVSMRDLEEFKTD